MSASEKVRRVSKKLAGVLFDTTNLSMNYACQDEKMALSIIWQTNIFLWQKLASRPNPESVTTEYSRLGDVMEYQIRYNDNEDDVRVLRFTFKELEDSSSATA